MVAVETDWELLREYAHRGCQRAYTELVTRHINMVHSAALRQVRDPHLAEDVAQAVFIILARKASSLPPATIISAWLLTAVRYASANALRMRARRQRHEHKAGEEMRFRFEGGWRDETPAAEAEWADLAPVIDEAVSNLRQADREAIALRFFERKSLREVGQALGINEEAAKKRVARALERLRQSLRKNSGLAVPAAALSVMLLDNAVEAAPVGLEAIVAHGALANADPLVAEYAAGDLAHSTSVMMGWTKTRWLACGMMVALLAVGPVTFNYAWDQYRAAVEQADLQREGPMPQR